MASAPNGSDSDLSKRSQQSPLASQRAKQAGLKTVDGYFPLGYKEGFNQWWASISPALAEHRVLSFIPYLQKPPTHTETGLAPISTTNSTMSIVDDPSRKAEPVATNSVTDPYGPRRWHSNLVKLKGKDRALNEFSVERIGEQVEENMVMIHGYGAGLGFFYKNFEGMSRPKGWKLWALDLLGMGRSSRPPFNVQGKDPQSKIAATENWFIDALEEWRVQRNIDKFTLMGHSLGGYMAVAYALKYPGHLKKLILASPVGIPEDPYAVNAEMPEPENSTLANEFTQDQTETVNGTATPKTGDNNNFLNARTSAKQKDGAPANAPPRRRFPKLLGFLWDANISPFSIVRWGGPLGPRFVSGWTSRRFSFLPPAESQALHDYSYSLFRQRGSGEYALTYVLAPGAFARSPLIRRIQGVGRQVIPSGAQSEGLATNGVAPELKQVRELGIPIVLLYGENDWMDVAGGYAAAEKIKAERERILASATVEEKAQDRGSSKVLIVKNAGHHVYLDGWEEFNKLMLEEMEDVSNK